jgi:hypothetical protein
VAEKPVRWSLREPTQANLFENQRIKAMSKLKLKPGIITGAALQELFAYMKKAR